MANHRQVEENYAPLRVSRAAVERHWRFLQGNLNEILPRVGDEYFIEPTALRGAVGDLRCTHFRRETAHRERGISVTVVPLIEAASTDVRYWLSLHQEWLEDPTPQSKRLVYHTTGLTVYFGNVEHADKLQLFRAEWAGVRIQSEAIFVFEAQGAGHPHWQFDVYQSRANEVEGERKRIEELVRALEETVEVEEFTEMMVEELSPENVVSRNACMQRLSRIHFASCANWSKVRWNGDDTQTRAHAQGPANVTEIQNWVVSTIIYIRRELSR